MVIAIAMTMFFGCKNDFGEVQKVGVLQNQPISEAINIDLKYTELQKDTVHLLANLISPKMLDYSNRDFSFREFPEGILLKIYDENGRLTTIKSKFATFYTKTNIIDLRDNVVITTHESERLYTEQLYYNEELEWVFTNEPWLFNRSAGPLHGLSLIHI